MSVEVYPTVFHPPSEFVVVRSKDFLVVLTRIQEGWLLLGSNTWAIVGPLMASETMIRVDKNLFGVGGGVDI